MEIIFSKRAARAISRLGKEARKRIIAKLHSYLRQENPLRFAERLKDCKIGECRFRIGDYRVLFDTEDNKIIVLKVGHRRDIYKDC